MSDPYIGEIRMFAGNFPPAGWAFCNGALMPISENDALFALIGTTFGGDGQETFALPNLQSRVPVHPGTQAGLTHQLGEMGGSETVTVTTQQVPAHSHAVLASTSRASGAYTASNGVLANAATAKVYGLTGTPAAMHTGAIGIGGNSQPHENMAPYLGISFIISLFGIFPHQS